MIYFIQSGENGPIKIGYTSNKVRSRMSELQCGNPVKLSLLGCIEQGTLACEKAVHLSFSHLRIRGEWFHATSEITEYISDRCVLPVEKVEKIEQDKPHLLPDMVPADDFRLVFNVSHDLPEEFAGGKNVLQSYFKVNRGSKSKLAQYLGTTRGAISHWKICPLSRVNAVSEFTSIPKKLLRPDIFGEAT